MGENGFLKMDWGKNDFKKTYTPELFTDNFIDQGEHEASQRDSLHQLEECRDDGALERRDNQGRRAHK